jgi:metallo-beta-lactamase class B
MEQKTHHPIKYILPFVLIVLGLGCNAQKKIHKGTVYRSDALVLEQLTKNTYVHTSFLNTQDFGRVACNGMIVSSNGEAVIFDAPTTDIAAQELIQWVEDKLKCRIKALIPTHFHLDCLGSLGVFHERGIPSYANQRTIALAQSHNFKLPQNGFEDHLELKVGATNVFAQFFGEGHTKDNIIGYFPKDRIIFGGCLIKESGAGKGNLEDANTDSWPLTVSKIKEAHPNIRTVVPGHGAWSGTELLDYTMTLFQEK